MQKNHNKTNKKRANKQANKQTKTKTKSTKKSKTIGLFNLIIIQPYLLNQQPNILYVDSICWKNTGNRATPLPAPMQSQVCDGVFQPVIEK